VLGLLVIQIMRSSKVVYYCADKKIVGSKSEESFSHCHGRILLWRLMLLSVYAFQEVTIVFRLVICLVSYQAVYLVSEPVCFWDASIRDTRSVSAV